MLDFEKKVHISMKEYICMTPFEAIAEPHRRRLLELLRAGERPAGELVEAGVPADDARAISDEYRACETARFSPDDASMSEYRSRSTPARRAGFV